MTLSAWQVTGEAKDRLPTGESVREKSLAIVRLMPERGLYAGDLARNGIFASWP